MRLRFPWRYAFIALAAVVLSLFVTKVYWGETFPYTHDGSNHLARFMNYAAALREGQYPPRFAPYLFSGFGFPIFHYNYPLANILSLPFTAVGLNPEKTFAALATLSLTTGVAATFLGLRRYFPFIASSVATVLYVFSAYPLTNIFFRGGIGELMAYALLPVCFLSLDTWQTKQKRLSWLVAIGTLTLLLLAHNVLALMSCFLLGLWSLSWVVSHPKQLKEWFLLWASSVGLVIWFWMPALAELSLVALSGNNLTTEAAGHVLEWQEFLSPWRFGFSRIGPLDSYGFGLGPATIAALFLAISCGFVVLFRQRRIAFWSKHESRVKFLLIGGLVLSLFLSLKVSEQVWLSFPLLSFFQFPWRWLFLTTLLSIPVCAWMFQRLPSLGKLIFLALMLWQVFLASQLRPVDRFHYERDYYLFFPHSTTTSNEDRPLTLTLDTLPKWEPTPSIATGEAVVNVVRWTGSQRVYSIEAKTDLVVQEPSTYFPGWEVVVDGKLTEIDKIKESGGLVSYSLSSRTEPYQIRSGFTGRTPVRMLSECISLLTLASIIAYSVIKRKS